MSPDRNEENPISPEEKLSIQINGAINEAINASKRISNWDEGILAELKTDLATALTEIHDEYGGWSDTRIIREPNDGNRHSITRVVKTGEPQFSIFDLAEITEKPYLSEIPSVIRELSTAFVRAHNLLQSGISTVGELEAAQLLSEEHEAGPSGRSRSTKLGLGY